MGGTPYQQGNAVTLDATFLIGSTPTDPSTVTFKIRYPDDTIVTYVYGVDPEVSKISTGVYECDLGVPVDAGQYHYEAIGTGTAACTLPGEFYVIPSSVIVPPTAPGPILGPCRTWINGEDLVMLCNADPATDMQQLDAVAVEASMLMWELSGRQFNGLCERTVRPCGTGCNGWPRTGIYPWWGYVGGYGWAWYGDEMGPLCGCVPLSRVKLAGYPVREITEVKIDGVVLAETDGSGDPNYRLDGWQWLTRMADPTSDPATQRWWPSCQAIDLEDTEAGTFSVSYLYGVDPPPMGIEAAKQFACQLFKSITGGDCVLPANVTKIVRQGLTQERITPVAQMLRKGGTGIFAVDAFISGWNPNGLRRRPTVWSPDIAQYAQRGGST